MSRAVFVSFHPLSASTHVTLCSMVDHQTLLLNLHGRSFSSLSTPTTHHCQNPVKIKSQNEIPKAFQITNQITPTEIKAQNPQNNQNHKMKTLKVKKPTKSQINSPSKPPWSELFKLINSNHAPLPKSSQNKIATKTQKPTKSQIKSHPPKSKHKTHKTTKITK